MPPDTNIAATRFDREAQAWDSNPARVALARGIAAAIRDTVPLTPDMAALDFGAGTGLLTLALLPDVATVTAVDTSGEMLRVLNEKVASLGISNVTTRHCDINRDSLPEGHFSLVFSSMVLHHIQHVPAALRLLHRSLSRGGWIALADLETEDGSFHSDATGVYHNGFAPADLCRWLTDAGFTSVSTRVAYVMRRPAAGGSEREYPILLSTARA